MNNKGNNNIPSSRTDDELLTVVTKNACETIREKFLFRIPDTWDFECGTRKISFKEIRTEMINEGVSFRKADSYYGGNSSIETDAHVIYLVMSSRGGKIRKPIFIGEMKKQGTNDQRVMEGKKRQSIGNAGTDRVAKNFEIASDYCYLCDKEFFPYNVFLHGCDFKEEEITGTTKAKLQPFFGDLNTLNPYFDKDIFWARKGGSCFYQGEDYTYGQLYDICYKCCESGVLHYLSKYSE